MLYCAVLHTSMSVGWWPTCAQAVDICSWSLSASTSPGRLPTNSTLSAWSGCCEVFAALGLCSPAAGARDDVTALRGQILTARRTTVPAGDEPRQRYGSCRHNTGITGQPGCGLPQQWSTVCGLLDHRLLKAQIPQYDPAPVCTIYRYHAFPASVQRANGALPILTLTDSRPKDSSPAISCCRSHHGCSPASSGPCHLRSSLVAATALGGRFNAVR